MEKQWEQLPIICLTQEDKELGNFVLAGLSYEDKNKFTRGFVYYQIVNGLHVLGNDYAKFLELVKVRIIEMWGEQHGLDQKIEGKTVEELEWDFDALTYYNYIQGLKKVKKVI